MIESKQTFTTIPSNWQIVPMKAVAQYSVSNVNKHSLADEEAVRLCNYTDVYKNERITLDMDLMRATATAEEISKFHLEIDDVVITKDSESWDDIAVPAYVAETSDDLVCGYHLAILRPVEQKLNGRFLFRCLQSRPVALQLELASTGVTRYGLPKGAIGSAFIPLPPLDIQKKIADYLDRETTEIDALIAEKERMVSLLEENREVLISKAVTHGLNSSAPLKTSGVDWLGNIPEHWEVSKIKYLTKILRGKFSHRPRNDPKLYDGKYPFIQTGDVANANKYITEYTQTLNEDGYAVSKEFPSGTLVMTIAANIGDMAILDFNACFPDSIVGFLPSNKTSVLFLYYLFVSMRKQFLSTAVMNTQLNLNVERISNLITVIPPLNEQIEIIYFLNEEIKSIDQLSSNIKKSIALLKERRSALITAAVTGQIELEDMMS